MPACPICGGAVKKGNFRPIDRIENLIVPIIRYHCDNPNCAWEGNRLNQSAFLDVYASRNPLYLLWASFLLEFLIICIVILGLYM